MRDRPKHVLDILYYNIDTRVGQIKVKNTDYLHCKTGICGRRGYSIFKFVHYYNTVQ